MAEISPNVEVKEERQDNDEAESSGDKEESKTPDMKAMMTKAQKSIWNFTYKVEMKDRLETSNKCIRGLRIFWPYKKRILLLLAILLYSFIGGAVFYAFEKPHEESVLASNQAEILKNRNNYATKLLIEGKNCNNVSCLEKILEEYDEVTGVNNGARTQPYTWQVYMNAVWYASTLYTTIGYGNLAPATNAGKIITIIYALFGIPLMLTFLNDLGNVLCDILNAAYKKVLQVCCRKSFTDTNTARLPVTMSVLIIFLYLFLCALVMMSLGRQWNYLDAVYFFFITFATIGLGDVMPQHPYHMLWSFLLFIFGLILVSMIINNLNAKLQEEYFEAMDNVEENLRDDEAEIAFTSAIRGFRVANTDSPKVKRQQAKQQQMRIGGLGGILGRPKAKLSAMKLSPRATDSLTKEEPPVT